MTRAYVSFGANIEPEANLLAALRLLARREHVVSVSTVYRSAAIGRPEQDDYLNCVVAIETDMQPLELKRALRRIETELGRVRGPDKYAARTIDLDLVAYDELEWDTDELILPDPDIGERPFLAAGLAELAPGLRLPENGLTVAEAAARLGAEGITPLPEYTERLRGEIGDGQSEG